MGKKMLGKVVAGAALGGASLLLFSPGAAYAAGHAYTGNVVAKPQVSLLEFCPEDHGDWDHKDWDRKDHDGKDHDRKDEDRDNKDHDGKDRDRKDEDRKDWNGNSDETWQSESGQGGGMADDKSDEDRNNRDNKDHDGKDRDRKDEDRRDHDDRDHCMPRGHVDGGDGGMTTTSLDRGMAASGVGAIGAAALGGMVLLRRRRANDLG
ncbi:hypothetical protein [Micromonospora sp. IBHARD004]|uniref:hypothetical protein n=1 Tax=Micromonospora sp. IBHARD004 TaxID=3457764 RepID=UPI0040591C38